MIRGHFDRLEMISRRFNIAVRISRLVAVVAVGLWILSLTRFNSVSRVAQENSTSFTTLYLLSVDGAIEVNRHAVVFNTPLDAANGMKGIPIGWEFRNDRIRASLMDATQLKF